MLARIVLWIAGLGFIGFGIAFLIAPLETLAAVGVAVTGEIAAIELRAFYGGLEIGIGLALLVCDLQHGWRRGGLLLVIASYGAIGLVRAFSMLLAGLATPFLWIAIATELGLAALAAVALMRDPDRPAAAGSRPD